MTNAFPPDTNYVRRNTPNCVLFRAAGRRKVTSSFYDLPTCGAVAVAAPLLLHATLEAMTHTRIIRRETLRHFKWLRGFDLAERKQYSGVLVR